MIFSPLKKYVKNKWIRFLLILIAAFALYALQFGKQTYLYNLSYRMWDDIWTEMKIVPTVRKIQSPLNPTGQSYQLFGFSMLLPETQIENVYGPDSEKGILFKNNTLLVFTNPKDVLSNQYLSCRESKDDSDKTHFKQIFLGKIANNFNYIKSSIFTIPNYLKVFTTSTSESVLNFYKTNTKARYILQGNKPDKIYYFEFINCKVFQFGDPDKSKFIFLSVFPDNETELEIKFLGTHKGQFTQMDIDRFILNLRKL